MLNACRGRPLGLDKMQEETKMSKKEIAEKVKELRELRRMAEELAAEIETLQDSIKEEMDAQGAEMLSGDDWKVTWKPVTSDRLDSAALKKELPEIAARFMKHTTTRRFCVA